MSTRTSHATTPLERAIHSPKRPMSLEAAKEIIQWNLASQDDRRMEELVAKSRSIGLNKDEMEEFESLCFASDIIAILHLSAREAMGEFEPSGA